MDNYTRVPKQKDQENTPRNEIRITSTGKTRRYISYGVALLDPTLLQHDDEDDKEQKQQQDNQTFDFIVLKGMGQAINKTVSIAEVIKRRVANLHQLNEIHSTTITDEWEPKSEGLEKQSTTRNVSAISITLSKKQLNVNDPGYQAPISADLIQPMQIAQPRKKKTAEEKVDNAATQGAEKTSDETAKKADPEKKKKKKKKPTKKKAPATDKSGEVTENKTEQKDETKTESAPKTAEKKPRAPRKKKVPQQANSEQSNAQQQVASEEQQGSNQSARSANSSRGRGRGVRRYRGRGGKKTADGAPPATSSPQTKSE